MLISRTILGPLQNIRDKFGQKLKDPHHAIDVMRKMNQKHKENKEESKREKLSRQIGDNNNFYLDQVPKTLGFNTNFSLDLRKLITYMNPF